ncbi:thymidylate synthase [Frankia nepalensis]
MTTQEVMGAHLRLTDPRRRFVDLPPARVINPAFAVAEAVWILSGSDGPWIYDFNQELLRYTDGGVLRGAYGPRLRRWHGTVDQLDAVRRELLADADSRRAVVTLYDPQRDHSGHRDVPCTLAYRFFLRAGRLEMHTTMRSQDLWLGFPYDIFTATLIHELLAGWLGAPMGDYHHHVDSLHLYAHNRDGAMKAATDAAPVDAPGMAPMTVEWDDLEFVLGRVAVGDYAGVAGSAWAPFARVLASYRAWRAGDRDQARSLTAHIPGVLGAALGRWYDLRTTRSTPVIHTAGGAP